MDPNLLQGGGEGLVGSGWGILIKKVQLLKTTKLHYNWLCYYGYLCGTGHVIGFLHGEGAVEVRAECRGSGRPQIPVHLLKQAVRQSSVEIVPLDYSLSLSHTHTSAVS